MSSVGWLRSPYPDRTVPFSVAARLDALKASMASTLLEAGARTIPKVTPLITYGNGVISLLPAAFLLSFTARSVLTTSKVSIGICIASSLSTRSEAPATCVVNSSSLDLRALATRKPFFSQNEITRRRSFPLGVFIRNRDVNASGEPLKLENL